MLIMPGYVQLTRSQANSRQENLIFILKEPVRAKAKR